MRQPAAQLPVHLLRSEDVLLRRRQVGRVQQEGVDLVAAEAAVRADQLLEGARPRRSARPTSEFTIRSAQCGKASVRRDLRAARARRTAPAGPGRVTTPVVELELAVGTEDDRPVAPRLRDEQEADAGMRRQGGDQVGVAGVDLLACSSGSGRRVR